LDENTLKQQKSFLYCSRILNQHTAIAVENCIRSSL